MVKTNIHRKLYEYVEEEIGTKIITGVYPPGDTLPNEDALCSEFGVSKGVVREAIKVLNKKGLVQPRPKIGTLILPRSQWNLFDADVLSWKLKTGKKFDFLKKVTEVRRIIESEAVKIASCRATPEEIKKIRHLYDQMSIMLNSPSEYTYEKYLEIDMMFHTAILEASHNELLAQIGHTIRNAVHAARRKDHQDIKFQMDVLPFHAAMLEALETKDPEAAHTAARKMFEDVNKS
ncbi:MAG: FadR family transcriptional regulator, partial [Deltaproteobacteria bacterium]|nr:FadR family transcriptional regulator [Deltaproteobacteria bacterium]